jgi:hypothetical protein
MAEKEAILAARDHLLQLHPNLKSRGRAPRQHGGGRRSDRQRFDKYPNFAVDTAARVDYLMMQKPEKVRAFLIKYQDRVVYGTDNVLYPPDKTEDVLKDWAARYERDWRYFSGEADVKFEEGTTKGLHLPKDVLRKLYHRQRREVDSPASGDNRRLCTIVATLHLNCKTDAGNVLPGVAP